MNRKVRLLHIISSMQQGGAENLLVQLVASLGSERYEHHVVYFHDGPCVEGITDPLVYTYHLQGRFFLYDPWWWYRLVSLVRSIKPDIIHSHLWAAHIAGRVCSKFFAIPLVATYHTPLLESDNYMRKQIDAYTMRYERFSCAVSTSVAATWKPLARNAAHMTWHMVPNGVDIARFDAAAHDLSVTRQSLGIPEDAFVYGSVGRFIHSKRYDTLIDACALLRDKSQQTYLLLLGWGPEEQQLRERAQKRGVEDRVIFVVGKQAAPYYHLMDVFMLPSEREGMSMALLEAMASSLPVIIVQHDGMMHEVVTDRMEGIVLTSHSPSTLAGAMIHMQLFSDEVANYKKAARTTVENHFSLETMRSRYQTLYEALTNDI